MPRFGATLTPPTPFTSQRRAAAARTARPRGEPMRRGDRRTRAADSESRGTPHRGAPRTKCVRDAYFGTRPISSGPVDARRTPAAPSSSMRSAAASPVPILRLRVRAVPGVRVRRCTRAGATISLASIARRRILSSRATTDASTRSPLESGLPSSGTAIRFVDGDVSGVRSVACAVLLESLRRPVRRRDDLCIALTSRLGPQNIPGSEHQQGRQPHRSLAVPSIRRRTREIAALAAVAATTAVTPDLTPLGGWMSSSADLTPEGSCASRVALTTFSSRVLRRNGLMSILSVRSFC